MADFLLGVYGHFFSKNKHNVVDKEYLISSSAKLLSALSLNSQ